MMVSVMSQAGENEEVEGAGQPLSPTYIRETTYVTLSSSHPSWSLSRGFNSSILVSGDCVMSPSTFQEQLPDLREEDRTAGCHHAAENDAVDLVAVQAPT